MKRKEIPEKKKGKKINTILIKENLEETKDELKMEKEKREKILTKIAFYGIIVLFCYFAIQVLSTLITVPILTFYGAAYDFYSLNNDPSIFLQAKSMTIKWISHLVLLVLSGVGYILLKRRREKYE